jgi:hypothetical protein
VIKKHFDSSKTSILYKIRWEITLLIILILIYSIFYLFSEKTHIIFGGDYELYRLITHSIAYDFDLKIDNNFPPTHPGDTGRSLGKDNVTQYPRLPWIMSLFDAPIYRFFGEKSLPIRNLISMILGVYFVYFLIFPLVGKKIAFISVLINGLSSALLEWGYHYATDVFIIPFITGGLALWIGGYSILAGIALSIAGIGKHYYWILLPLIMLVNFYIEYRKPKNSENKNFGILKRINFSIKSRNVWGILVGSFIIITIYGYVNYSMFGSPFLDSYRRIMTFRDDGSYLISDTSEFFQNSLSYGLQVMFFRRSLGIFYFSPFILLLFPSFIISLFLLIKSKGSDTDSLKFSIIFLGSIISFIVIALYSMNVNTEWGNRFILSDIALSSVSIAYLIEKIIGKNSERLLNKGN